MTPWCPTKRQLSLACTAVQLMAGAFVPAAVAQDNYPTRIVKLVVPFPAGGPTDFTARLFSARMTKDLGQQFVIENRAGADSAIGAQQVARTAPDGYTLLFAMDVTMVMNPVTKKSLSYDPLQDFQVISLTSLNTSLLVVPANGPKTVQELIAHGKANPGKLNYGAGIVTTRLAGYLFSKLAGIEAVFVPYKGSSEVVTGLLDGSIQYAVDGVSAHLPMIQTGKTRALAKLNGRPLASLPDLKPLHEVAGMPQLGEISTWGGIVGPRGLPVAITERLRRSIEIAANDEEVKAKLLAVGIVATSNKPDEFMAFIRSELNKWSAVVKEGGIQFAN